MKVIKPYNQSLLHKTFESNRKYYFTVSIISFFDFGNPRLPLSEADMWKFLPAEMGREFILDACMPKQMAEYLINGRCFDPHGRAVTGLTVRARVGGLSKSLAVFGDRFWKHSGDKVVGRSEPAHFTEMPIDYSHAFGGKEYSLNPLGKGKDFHQEKNGVKIHPLPNIENPKHLIVFDKDMPEPAGFAALDISWPQRMNKAGTYDRKWLESDFPGFARNMDWSIFNTAQPDQWFEGFLKGDESFEFEHMHPEKSRLESALPGIRSRCFINREMSGELKFLEMETRPDTVQFFPHAEKGLIIWRSTAEIGTDDASDIRHILIAYERIEAEARTAEHYRDALLRRLDKDKGWTLALFQDDLIPPEDKGLKIITPSEEEKGLFKEEGLMQKNARARAEKEMEKTREKFRLLGLDADKHLPKMPEPGPRTEPSQVSMDEIDAMLTNARKQAFEEKDKAMALARENCRALGVDFDKLMQEAASKPQGGKPKFSAKQVIGQMEEFRNKLSSSGQDTSQIDTLLKDGELEKKLLNAEDKLKRTYRQFAHHFPAGVEALEPDESARVRGIVAEGFGRGESFAEGEFTGADLSGLDMKGIDFRNALLEEVNFSGADLSGANLSGAVLVGSDFKGTSLKNAILKGANFGRARLSGADLSSADLENAVFVKADLTDTRLESAILVKADFSEAIFGKTDFSNARLPQTYFIKTDLRGIVSKGGDFSKCVFIETDLRDVDFSGACLESAVFVGVRAEGAVFAGAKAVNLRVVRDSNFAGADFSGTDMKKSNLRGTNLEKCRFIQAILTDADFSGCNLKETDFYRATALNTQFVKADLTNSRLISINLYQGSLRKAQFFGADFRGANLFAVDFEKSRGDTKTDFRDANLKMTRMIGWRPAQ